MPDFQVRLEQGEEVLAQSERAVLTNRRLIAGLNRKDRAEITDAVPLSDIPNFKKSNGGQASKMRPGLQALALGVVLVILQLLLSWAGFFSVQPPESAALSPAVPPQADAAPADESEPILSRPNLLRWTETALFLGSAAGILFGVYLIIGSLMRIKPFTVVVFTVVGARDIPVHFPGFDNPAADDMTRLFVRAKRGI